MAKRFKEKSRGVYQGHCACPLEIKKGEPCGSSDGGAYYQHDDNSYSFSCFVCGGGIPEFDITTMVAAEGNSSKRVIDWEEEAAIMEDIKENLIPLKNNERRMTADVYEKYGVRMDVAEDGETIDKIYYPAYRENEAGIKMHVGYRNRKRFKEWHTAVKKDPKKLNKLKDFSGGVGDTKKGICLFGEHVFEAGGKRVILTCGEEDAFAVYKMTSLQTKFEGGYPTVSTPSGENIAWIKPRLKYLNSFKEIYIVADQDKAGREFEQALCQILPVGKVKLIRLPKGIKDPSDLWKRVKSKADQEKYSKIFYRALWDAESYSPAGVFTLSEGWDKYKKRGKATLIPFPDAFGDLNEKCHGGYALGEIINIIAPSSVGKSSFTKEMFIKALQTTPYNIGVIALEETIDEFIEGMLSIYMSTQLNEASYDEQDYDAQFIEFERMCTELPEQFRDEDYEPMDRIHFLDHQGAATGDDLLEKIDFLIDGLDCKIILVDPVTLGFSGRDTDEDDMASEIVRRVKRKGLAWINVHHVRKNQNGSKANSEGADLSEEDIKGTGAWFQTGMINLIFTRNKVHDNEVIKNTTKIKMSKCRRHGKNTGIAGFIYYNGFTGRLERGIDPALTEDDMVNGEKNAEKSKREDDWAD